MTGVQCLKYLRIPVLRRQQFTLFDCPPGKQDLASYIEFELIRLSYGCLLIYECVHCRNCGCPSFDWDVFGNQLPEDVVEHLTLHAVLCDPDRRTPPIED